VAICLLMRPIFRTFHIVDRKSLKTEREAREFGGLGAKPPVGSGAEPLYVRSRSFGRFVPIVFVESDVMLLC
jgi:hypothetical protein